MNPMIGVLALQGGVEEHLDALQKIGAQTMTVRTARDLDQVDALILPGGESPAHHLLLKRLGLLEQLQRRISAGMPVWGTCAGAILLANEVYGQEPILSSIDLSIVRNYYGSQLESFITELSVREVGENLPAVFIRAPMISRVGTDVEILGWHAGYPVACRQGNILVTTFHPELTDDRRFHRYFLGSVLPDGKVETGGEDQDAPCGDPGDRDPEMFRDQTAS